MNHEEFFKNIKNPLTDETLKEIIYRLTIPNIENKRHYLPYNNLLSPEHKDYWLNVNESDKLNFTTVLFNTWKFQITSLTDEMIKEYINRGIYKNSIYYLRNYLKTLPEVIESKDFYEIEKNMFQIMNNDYDEVKRYGWRKTDGNYWTKIYMDDVVGRKVNFIQNVDHRFYMNVNEKDLYKLAFLYIKKCYEKKCEYAFKFTVREKRDDAIVFYATDKNLDKCLEILNEIKKEYPEIFERCAKPPILTGLVDEKIGYGAEPTERIRNQNDDLASFNTLRCKIIEDSVHELAKKWMLNNRDTHFVTYNHKKMSLGDYFIFRQAEIRYNELLKYSTKYSQEEMRTYEFKRKLLDEFMKNKEYILTGEGNSTPNYSSIIKRNRENLEKEILRNIISMDPNFLKELKESIKIKCIQYDIDPENFAVNIGKQYTHNIEEEIIKQTETTKESLEKIYNEYIQKININSSENEILKDFGNVYKAFISKIESMSSIIRTDKIEKYKSMVSSKIKELYSKYYLQLQELKQKDNIEDKIKTIPSFKELKELKDKYSIVNTEHYNHKIVIEKETGKQVVDSKIINDVNFAYLWLYAAQIKVFANDDEGYAFNNLTEESYKFFITEISKQIKETGTIDSIKLFRQARIHSINYKYTAEIITKLFGYQPSIKKIENLLRDRGLVENNALEDTKELYGDLLIATRLAAEENNEQIFRTKCGK